MPGNKVVSREEWLTARLEVPGRGEGVHPPAGCTNSAPDGPCLGSALEKSYQFAGPNGTLSLAELFDGRSQLIVYHFMLGPDWEEGCKSCSFWADNFNNIPIHLNHRDVTFIAMSRAPFAKIDAYKKRMGWGFPWVSSHGSDFNFDYQVSFTPEQIARVRRYTNYAVSQTPCPSSSVLASSTRITMATCSTPTPAIRAASTCSTAPITISTLCRRGGMKAASSTRWNGFADTTSIEAAVWGRFGGMPMTQKPSGGCTCGAIHYDCSADPINMFNCHVGTANG